MFYYLKENRQFVQLLLIWLIVGIFIPQLLYFLLPLSLFILQQKEKYLELLIGFFIILTFSDSRQSALSFAANVKAIYLVLLAFFYVIDTKKILSVNNLYKNFIPFFLIAIYSMFLSEQIAISFEKTLSYFLLILLIPNYVNKILNEEKDRLLQGIVYFGAIFIFAGFILFFLNPDFVYLNERYCGILGNPNGLGIFCLLYGILFITIKDYYPYFFSKKFRYILLISIFLSLILAGSRGGLISFSIFLLFRYFSKLSNIASVLLFIAMIISYQIILSNIEDIIIFFDLERLFRLETLEAGSGRLVAFEFAWENIQKNFYFGKGFFYSEDLFISNQHILNPLGHQGLTHNSYLSIWLDTGLIGLLFFIFAWGRSAYLTIKYTHLTFPIIFGIIFSTNIETWLSASLNPFTIQFIIILTLLNNQYFFDNEETKN